MLYALYLGMQKLTTGVIFTLLICFTTAVTLNAQIDFRNFRLDTFRLPDINRKALVGSGSLSGQYRGIENRAQFNTDLSRSSFIPNLDLDYDHLINTRALQIERSIDLNQSFSSIHEKQINNDELSKTSFNSFVAYSATTRKYKALKFFQTGLSGSFSYDYDRERITEATLVSLTKDKDFSLHLNPAIGFGHGRLEPVSTLAMAMFILKDAEELGLDLTSVTTEDIYSFASLMTQVSNRRIFDSRRMRIAELRDLYAFMLTQGWVLQNDPGYFTVLTDNWFYAPFFLRQSGRRLTYLFQPEFLFSHTEPGFFAEDAVRSHEYAVNFIVDYRKYQPVDLYFDTWHSHTATLRIADSETNSQFSTPPSDYAQLKLENRLGQSWFPSTRTSILGGVFLNYSYYRFIEPFFVSSESDQHVVNTGASLLANYFLSFRSQLTVNGTIQYGYSSGGRSVSLVNGLSSSQTSTGFNAQVSASLIVAIW